MVMMDRRFEVAGRQCGKTATRQAQQRQRQASSTAPALRPVRGQVVSASIWDLLQWAFQRECARLEFGMDALIVRPAFGTEYVMMQRARLGCSVDGGGSSPNHPDADVVAGALACLPAAYGGRPMAASIAGAARAGMLPDAMVGARTQAHPVEVNRNQFGTRPAVKDAKDLGAHGWPNQVRINRRGNRVTEAVLYTPIRWSPTPAQIGAARRGYLEFWGGLMALRDNLRTDSPLVSFTVTEAMPPMTPWKQGA